MAEKSKNNITVLSAPFRMSFPNLIDAKVVTIQGRPQGDPIFSMTGILEPADTKKFQIVDPKDPTKLIDADINLLVAQIAKAEWPTLDLKVDMAKTWPVYSGDVYAEQQVAKGKSGDAYVGKKMFNMKAQQEYPPTLRAVVDGKVKIFNRGMQADMQLAKHLFTGGHYAVAELNLVPYKIGPAKDGSFTYYVTAYMNNVRFVKEGERFGGQSMMDRFAGVDGGSSDIDPTRDLASEIPV